MRQKSLTLILLMAAGTAAAVAQTKPAAPPATTKPATAAQKSTGATTGVRLPPGVPPARGIVKTAFALRYQDIKIGTGAQAEYIKSETVNYTGWLAADGRKFDSSYERREPVTGADGKPEKDADGSVKLSDPHPVPFSFVEGNPRLISGWNLGIDGMKVGGKRRLFIPWQMAYGAQGRPGPDAAHPGIPPKADLIFDVELLEVKDTPMPPSRPAPAAMAPNFRPPPGGVAPRPVTPGSPVVPPQPGAPAATPTPPAPVTSPAPATPPQPQ